MSKKYLVELIQMSDESLNLDLEQVSVKDFRESLRIAMKEQDRDTRHACAEAVIKGSFWSDAADEDVVRVTFSHNTIINCNAGIGCDGI